MLLFADTNPQRADLSEIKPEKTNVILYFITHVYAMDSFLSKMFVSCLIKPVILKFENVNNLVILLKKLCLFIY